MMTTAYNTKMYSHRLYTQFYRMSLYVVALKIKCFPNVFQLGHIARFIQTLFTTVGVEVDWPSQNPYPNEPIWRETL